MKSCSCISFTFYNRFSDKGEFVTIVGHTGSGKSTLGKALAEKYAAALNKLTSTVSFPVYSIIAPTSVEFVDIPYDVKQSDDFYNSSQKTFTSNVNNAANSSAVDVYTAISSKVSEEYLYMKTDKIIEKMLENCDIELEVDYLKNKEKYNSCTKRYKSNDKFVF